MTLRSMIAIPGTTKIPNAEANLVPRQNGFGSAGEYLVAPKRKRTAFFLLKGVEVAKMENFGTYIVKIDDITALS